MERIRKILFCVICSMFVAAGMAFTHVGEVQAEETKEEIPVVYYDDGSGEEIYKETVEASLDVPYFYEPPYTFQAENGKRYVLTERNSSKNRFQAFEKGDAIQAFYTAGEPKENTTAVKIRYFTGEGSAKRQIGLKYVRNLKVGDRYVYGVYTSFTCDYLEEVTINQDWERLADSSYQKIEELSEEVDKNIITISCVKHEYQDFRPAPRPADVKCIDNMTGKTIWETLLIKPLKMEEDRMYYTPENTIRTEDGATYVFDAGNAKNRISFERDEMVDAIVVYYGRVFNVKFDANGGKRIKKKCEAVNGLPYGELPEAKRKGYIFEGWYTKKKGGNRVDAAVKVNLGGDQTLYARWAKLDKSIGKVKLNKPIRQGKRNVKLAWKQAAGAEGYEILCADNRKLRGAKTYDSTETELTLKKLKKGKTYYIKARGYRRKAGGQRVYGAYGKVKKVRIK